MHVAVEAQAGLDAAALLALAAVAGQAQAVGFGASPTALNEIFPRLSNFTPDLGFMA